MTLDITSEEQLHVTGGYIVVCNPDWGSTDPVWEPIDPLPPTSPGEPWPMTLPACW
jgi:hypothetical protein